MSNIAGKAYGMNVLTPMSPGLAWLQRLIFMVARAFPGTLSGLLNLSLIHFARWVIIKRNQWPAGDRGKPVLAYDYVLFCSNFNGTWDQYIDAFSDGIPQGLDLFWYASEKFPHSIPITPFKSYIVHNQFDTNYYYNATPGSAQRDIKAALKVYTELKSLEEKHRGLDAQAFASAYNKSLARIQNCLGSPGFAPVASVDTQNADRNRATFVAAPGGTPAAAVPAKGPVAAVPPPAPANSFDGGHCFLTTLLPIKTCEVVDKDGMRSSPVHMVRDALAVLPTARQSPATESLPVDSPFTRSTRTHFARMAVIDDVIFNGRPAPRGLLDFTNRTIFGHVDQLPCPYLLLGADCDARDEEELRDYLREIWRTMGADLQPVFTNCFGYDQTATSADGFADYIVAHRIGTTMPFNDYWAEKPSLPTLSIPLLVVAGLVGAAVVFTGLYLSLCALHASGAFNGFLVDLVSIITGICVAYYIVMRRGARPFPAAPNSDLPSVLKALYLQRELIAFAIGQQGAAPSNLYQAFGRFLSAVQVSNIAYPSQAPGTISGIAPIPGAWPGRAPGTIVEIGPGNIAYPGHAPGSVAGTV